MAVEARARSTSLDPARPAGNRVTLVAVALASVLLPMTVTGPAVALPDLAVDVGSGIGAAQWVQNAYGVTFAAFLLAAGGLADRFGRRRVLVVGAVVFVACSAICGFSSNIVLIDITRAVQGAGAAGILTSGAAIFAASFEGARRTRAFGVLGASFGCGLALGPLASGALVQLFNWRAVFLVNVVVGLVALAMTPYIRESRNPDATRVDWAGLTTFSGALFLLALAFVEGGTHGWVSWQTSGSLVGSALLVSAFVWVESRSDHPVFDLSLFRRPTFVAVVCQPFTITFGFVVLLVYLPPYFLGVGNLSATTAGALLLPLTVPVFILPLVAGRIATRVPLRVMLATSSLLIAVGSLWLMVLEPGASWVKLVGPLVVFGTGVGSAFGVMDNAAVSVVPVERAGMASGIFNTMRITGESVANAGAAAALSTLTLAQLGSRDSGLGDQARVLAGGATQGRLDAALTAIPEGQRDAAFASVADSLTSAMHIVFVVLAVLAMLGAIATFLAVRDSELSGSK